MEKDHAAGPSAAVLGLEPEAGEVVERYVAPPPPEETGGRDRSGRAWTFLSVMLELVLVAAVVYLFEIEGQRHFFPVLCLIVGGFAIHAWLPMRYRLPFFAALSVACVFFVLGAVNGFWVIGVGGALIGICYLPFGFRTRLSLLFTAAAALILLRARFPFPFWPVLGSMFMFRLILYVYERRHATDSPPLVESIGYFFLLPNPCFPLFPVVDYRTFRDSRYNEEEREIYQRGVTWIVRGIVHLLLYRYVRTNLVPEPHDLYDVPHVALFMVTSYALYLQVSGQFHLITGLLHLFGFNLPRTHCLYFLASSCSDIWRRINIYWKDFMTKVFFFPTFHALRGRGAPLQAAVVAGVFWVFLCTWLLHSWQTFWLLGRFPVTVSDAGLWLGAGACVAINAAMESRRSARRSRPEWLEVLNLSMRTVAMFALVSLFWACWTTPGFLYSLRGVIARPGTAHGIVVVLLWAAAAVLAVAILKLSQKWRSAHGGGPRAMTFRDSVQLHLAGLGIVVAFASPWFGRVFPPNVAKAIAEFRSDAVARGEAGARLQSYYEDLNMAAIQAGPLMRSLSPHDETRRSQALGFAKVSRPADLYQEVELIPGIRTELDGSPFSVNRFGLRDRDSMTLDKPAGTTRIALVGSSIVMGYGVSDDEVFGRVFENRLNTAHGDRNVRFEVLNFGVGKQWATHRLVRIQQKVLRFEPDAVYYFAHQDEFNALASHTAKMRAHGLELPSEHLEKVVRSAGIRPDMAWGAIQGRLHPHGTEILRAVYATIVEECRSRGIRPVYVYLPIPGTDADDPADRLLPLAEEAGFIVCDLSSWAEGRKPEELFRSADEQHPDARGHRLIAEALVRMVQARPETLP